MWICVAPCCEHTSKRSGMAHVLKGSHSFTCTPRAHPLTEWPYLPLPSQPKLVLIYQPWRDGRLSWLVNFSWKTIWSHAAITCNKHTESVNLQQVNWYAPWICCLEHKLLPITTWCHSLQNNLGFGHNYWLLCLSDSVDILLQSDNRTLRDSCRHVSSNQHLTNNHFSLSSMIWPLKVKHVG